MRPNTIFKKSITTTRDLKILEFLIESKIASRDQLNSVFFKNSDCKRVVNKRINKLIHKKLITRVGLQIRERFLFCYRITDEGLKIVKSNLRLDLLKTPERSEKPDHDLILVDIRNKLLTLSQVTDYLTENALQCLEIEAIDAILLEFKKRNSDAALQVNINKKIFWLALEYENTLQSLTKIEKKIENIYTSEINAVLLVCKTSSMQNSFQSAEKKHLAATKSHPKIFYQTLDVLLSANKSISFENILNLTLTIL
jgi:hypothetical protein